MTPPWLDKDIVDVEPLFFCVVSQEWLPEDQLFKDSLAGVYFRKDLIDDYVKDSGTQEETQTLKNILLNEQKG